MPRLDKVGALSATYWLYIMTNTENKVLYIGVTSDIETRYMQHCNKDFATSFSAKYNLNKLVYYEKFESIERAIAREKQLKGGSRKKKMDLIESMNPNWTDLFGNRFDIQ